MSWYREWRPYVPVAKRRANAASFAAGLAKKEKRTLAPVNIEGRKIAQSFWGQAWCDNLERYSDFANRLPRGRTYVRNGSVIDLTIQRGKVKALVSGSEVYRVSVDIKTLERAAWKCIKEDCSQSVGSLIDLLRGRFDRAVMARLSRRDDGLFPKPKEIEMECSCPDWATLCKHVAAVLYGVGARLDTAPELLFTLRDVDHLELISQAVAAENLDRTLAAGADGALGDSNLGELFGIELDAGGEKAPEPAKRSTAKKSRGSAASKPSRRAAKQAAESHPAEPVPDKPSARRARAGKPKSSRLVVRKPVPKKRAGVAAATVAASPAPQDTPAPSRRGRTAR